MFPILAVYLLVLFYPFINLELRWGVINVPWVDIIALVLLPYVIIKKWRYFNIKRDFPGFIFYLVWLASGLLSLLNVQFDFLYSLKYFFRPVGFFYLMFVLLPWQVIRTPRRLEDVFRIFFVLGIFASLMGIYAYLSSSAPTFLERRVTPVSIFGLYPLGTNHNQIAELLIAAVPFSLLFLWIEQNEFRRKLIFLGILLMVLVNLLTFSRSGWLALFLEILLLAIIQYRYHFRKVFLYSFGILLILSPLIFYMFVFSRQNLVVSSTHNRIFLLNIAWNTFKDHPFIGNGLATFRQIVEKNKIYILEYGSPSDAHGFIQQIAAEQGLFGLLAFMALLAFVILRLWDSYRKFRHDPYWGYVLLSALIAASGSIFFQLFQTSYFNSKLWVPLGVCLIASLLAEKYGQKNYSHHQPS